MAMELLHTVYPDYLEVHIQGDRTHGKELDETAIIWKQLFGLSSQLDRNNILAHLRITKPLRLRDQIDLSMRLKDIGIKYDHRVAGITYSAEIYKHAMFVAKYVQSEGYDVRLFKSKDKAKRWLLQEKKKPSLLDIFDSFK